MRKIISIILVVFTLQVAYADNFSQMWKRVEQAQQAGMPKNMLYELNGIIQKAEAEGEWGHFLKAQLMAVSTQSTISIDSLGVMMARFEATADIKSADRPALKAVYNCILGMLSKGYHFGFIPVEEYHKFSHTQKEYFALALSDVDMLAGEKANNYQPLLLEGKDSRIFNNDLLHVIGFEAQEYKILNKYYEEHGNRAAACISAYYQTQKERFDDVAEVKKSRYLHTVDSIIDVYQDLPEAAELAIEHFNFMDQATDASSKEKIDYIDYVLRKWPTWPRNTILKNAKERITLPSFHAVFNETTILPNRQIPVVISSLINLSNLQLTVTKLKMTGAEEFNPNDEDDLKVLRSMKESKPVYQTSRNYYGLPDYKEVRDTMYIKPLPVGVYLVEFKTDNNDVPVERLLLHVTNLRLMDMDMPDKQIRLIAVDATTGKPVSDAKIHLRFSEWKKGRRVESEEILTTEKNGEVLFSSTLNPYKYRVTTNSDKAMEWSYMSASWNNYSNNENKASEQVSIITDRCLYRPGQIVKFALVSYNNNTQIANSLNIGKEYKLKVTDRQNKDLAAMTLTTDEWGCANSEFALPDTPGDFIINAYSGNKCIGVASISAEEYKRPTFTVSINEYTDAYKVGDTITVKGIAKSYSGMPVQGATVRYSYRTSQAIWWARYGTGRDGITQYGLTTTTDENGQFEMRIPLALPENNNNRSRFYNVNITANVTSISGESHEGTMRLPLSDKKQAIIIDKMGDKVCLQKECKPVIRVVNNAGKEVDTTVEYCIDGRQHLSAESNKPLDIDFAQFGKGLHTLVAYCEEDSVENKFTTFSLTDKVPVVDTDGWYYFSIPDAGNTDGDVLAPDATAHLQIGTSQKEQHVFYAIVDEGKVIEEGAFVLNAENHNREFTYREEWGNAVAMRYSWVRNGKIYSYEKQLRKPSIQTELNVEWTSFRDKVVPGEKEKWTAKISNTDGSKVQAHMIATIYDKSLDVLREYNPQLYTYKFTPHTTISSFIKDQDTRANIYGERRMTPLPVLNMEFSRFEVPEYGVFLDEVVVAYGTKKNKGSVVRTAAPMMAMAAKAEVEDVVVTEYSRKAAPTTQNAAVFDVMGNDEVTDVETTNIEVRKDLSETAAFLPTLVSNADGEVTLSFTLPESITSWKVRSVVHDKEVKVGYLEGEAIAQKQLMVQPNMPRFIREGDKPQVTALISNVTAMRQNGQAVLTLTEAETEKAVFTQKKSFAVESDATSTVTFELPATLAPQMYICKVVASTNKHSDGEQQYLPVLSRREYITTTRAITQVKVGKKAVNLGELFGNNTLNEKVTIEYTNNPAWLIADALPEAVKMQDCCAIGLSTSIFAATIGKTLKEQGVPFEMSTDTLNQNISKAIVMLEKLQNYDGSFSWWPDMPGSRYITLEVIRNLVRLNYLVGTQPAYKSLLDKGMKYLTKAIEKSVKEMKKLEKDGVKGIFPSEFDLDYLYLQAIGNPDLSASDRNNIKYLLNLTQDASEEFTIYGKAGMAVAYALSTTGQDMKKAEELIESIMQYSVATEEMGRYFDTRKAYSSWRNYKIPTESFVIEALQVVRPKDTNAIAEMRQWLLNEKRAQLWDTPLNSTSAIYAFLNGNMHSLDDTKTPAKIYLDGKTMLTSGKERGYFKHTEVGRHNTVIFDKQQAGMSFGCVKTEALQAAEDVVEIDGNQLHVTRTITDLEGKAITEYKVGDRVKVKITVKADRDMDFIEVTDNRASCMEPVEQLSGYRRNYYMVPGDNKTTYYINQLAKGRTIELESEYYIDRAGKYMSGTVEARCAYAPEFTARKNAYEIVAK